MDVQALSVELVERAATYRLLARLFFEPLGQGEIDALEQAFPYEPGMGPDPCGVDDGFNDIARSLRRRHSGLRQELAADFTGAFYGVATVDGFTAMPYESLFRCDGSQLMGVPRGEVYRALKESRLRVREGLDLPEDHLAFICAYLALLCDRTVDCLERGEERQAAELLERQASFFEAHLASWYDDFADRAVRLVETRFYRGCLKLGRAFVEEERRRLAPYGSKAAA